MRLPWQAFVLLCKDPKLFGIAILPGLLTLCVSGGALFFTWTHWLHAYAWWIGVPIAVIAFPLTWLLIGNFALLPFEDLIIDRVQKSLFGEVKIHSPGFSVGRVAREGVHSVLLILAFVLLLAISFVPGLGILSLISSAWITAWNFLGAIHHRKSSSFREKVRIFFKNIGGNTALGLYLNVLLWIPLLNVWLLGYALILATVVDLKRAEKLGNDKLPNTRSP